MSGGTLGFLYSLSFLSTGLLPSSAALSKAIPLTMPCVLRNPQPRKNLSSGLASSPSARRYLGNRVFFLFLQVLRCFSSLSYLLPAYFIQPGIPAHYCRCVSTFGNLRIDGYLLLPAAYRSLSRPSSAPSAKASALCPSYT